MTIKTIMTSDVLTMKPDVPFEQIQDVMRKVPFHHILVADDNKKLLGVISDRDLMSQVSKYINDNNGESFTDFLPRLSAADIMTADPITIDQDTPIDAASILLLEKNFSCLPVVNSTGHIDGIVTWKDLLKYYVYH